MFSCGWLGLGHGLAGVAACSLVAASCDVGQVGSESIKTITLRVIANAGLVDEFSLFWAISSVLQVASSKQTGRGSKLPQGQASGKRLVRDLQSCRPS